MDLIVSPNQGSVIGWVLGCQCSQCNANRKPKCLGEASVYDHKVDDINLDSLRPIIQLWSCWYWPAGVSKLCAWLTRILSHKK